MALKGHLLMHIPQPTQSSSEMAGFPLSSKTIVSSPVLTLGQYFSHSLLHLLG
jgi:hypothetical protein